MSRKPSTLKRGSIAENEILPLQVFLRRFGISRTSLTALKRQGLRTFPIGRRLFIDGKQAVAALRKIWKGADE